MAIRLPRMVHAKQLLMRRNSWSSSVDVPKGYCAVYVGESDDQKKRFVIPVAYLNQPSFQELLSQAEEEFGYDHPMGGLTIPCREDIFVDLTSRFSRSTNAC
ncbi:OLC1v1028027C1 [Oldenlandia corymbosa var. corymbosa]|uniref:OLC1v1028027C1 n=1 Tax=Oldenlandia corymbosa var. corymbosa TaxID=529605 RepID=A0AAV1CDH4_OLDCO|nr:OLC1v1028027C1 [Oldenlandia corymbosa var. corymbosa]